MESKLPEGVCERECPPEYDNTNILLFRCKLLFGGLDIHSRIRKNDCCCYFVLTFCQRFYRNIVIRTWKNQYHDRRFSPCRSTRLQRMSAQDGGAGMFGYVREEVGTWQPSLFMEFPNRSGTDGAAVRLLLL